MKKSKYHMQRPQIRLAILFLIPWITGLILFSLYPIVSTIYYSFTEYNLMKPPVVTGMKNYMDIFQDKNFYQSVYNSLYFVVVGVTLELALSIFSAILLNAKVKGRGIFRTMFYLPSIVSPVANAIIWMWMLNPQYGLVSCEFISEGPGYPAAVMAFFCTVVEAGSDSDGALGSRQYDYCVSGRNRRHSD